MNQEIPLFAIIGPRNEEDVIYATVKHMFTQGASRVFILDGGSTDSTREEAIDAGAEIVGIQKTEYYDDLLRCTEMHNIMRKKLDDSGLDKVWVAFLDSDEFLMPPSEKLTLHEFLSALSPVYNVVGGDNYNHFPVNKPYYIPRFHPLDFQPYYERFDSSDFPHGCPQNHWKHNVQLYIKGKRYPYNSGKGFHGFDKSTEPPTAAILIHHFPYRDKEATYKRYSEIATRLKKGCGITKRGKSLDFVYSQQWDKVDNLQIHKPPKGVKLTKWQIHYKKYRWYSELELQRTICR